MTWDRAFFVGAYLFVLALLAVYGLHRSLLLWLFYRNRHKVPEPARHYAEDQLPLVTVQCPLYNEMYVAERLLEAVSRLDYPRHKLEIQVLDDSSDETSTICQDKVAELLARGVAVHYLHRQERTGFKAGALQAGLAQARGELVLVFDADFVPQPQILRQMVHHFTDERVAMVQTRWGHVNRHYSALTEIEAIMLDGHFVIEHTARHRSGRFFNFNGTAGIWRVKAIWDSGGWDHDTLTEDMDLSYRAQLRGWRFVYLADLVSPAELPVEMNSFKSQQFRWCKGSIQVAKKLLPTILRADLPREVKWEAFFHLTNNVAYPLLLLLSLLLLPNLALRTQHGLRDVLLIDLPLFFGTTFSVLAFYLVSQRELRLPRGVRRLIWRLPLMLGVGIGLCVNQTRAVLEGLWGKDAEFVRTPKHGVAHASDSWTKKRYRAARSIVPFFELGMALYFLVATAVAISGQHYVALPFLLLFLVGYLYVGALSVYQRR
jgi:cellulose synthase/poly-beta-1,6-N-acetylglucosamine synthase-like glycosyltransferase